MTRQYNRMVPPDLQGALWQSSFYDVIIRDDKMLLQAREYVRYNPLKWAEDELYIP